MAVPKRLSNAQAIAVAIAESINLMQRVGPEISRGPSTLVSLCFQYASHMSQTACALLRQLESGDTARAPAIRANLKRLLGAFPCHEGLLRKGPHECIPAQDKRLLAQSADIVLALLAEAQLDLNTEGPAEFHQADDYLWTASELSSQARALSAAKGAGAGYLACARKGVKHDIEDGRRLLAA